MYQNTNPMNNNLKSNQLIDYQVSVKLKLASLWTSLMFLYIYADYFELKTPGKIQNTIDLKTPVGTVTPELLVIFSLLLIVPSIMIFLSVLLKPRINKWLNIVVATLYSTISMLIIAGEIKNFGGWHTFYVLYQFVEIFVMGIIIWQAWKWPVVENDRINK